MRSDECLVTSLLFLWRQGQGDALVRVASVATPGTSLAVAKWLARAVASVLMIGVMWWIWPECGVLKEKEAVIEGGEYGIRRLINTTAILMMSLAVSRAYQRIRLTSG
jgi:cysteine synthase